MSESSGQMEAVRKAAASGDREGALPRRPLAAGQRRHRRRRVRRTRVRRARQDRARWLVRACGADRGAARVGHRGHPQGARRLGRCGVRPRAAASAAAPYPLRASAASACSSSTTTTGFDESRRCSSKGSGTTSRPRATASKGSQSFSSASISSCSTSSCRDSTGSTCAAASVRIPPAATFPSSW